MKNYYFTIALFFVASFTAKALDANISFATFKSGDNPYIEVYLHVIGSTSTFIMLPDSNLQANMEVVILFKQNEEIIKFDKYLLNSPACQAAQDFFDVKRYGLASGDYKLEISVNDLNKADNARKYSQTFSIDFSENRVYQSDIQMVASLRKVTDGQADSPMAKGGYIFEPLPSQFLDKYCDRLIFYNEIYDTDKLVGDDFLASYYIESDGNKSSAKTGLVHKRRSADPVVPLLYQMDISNLKSGNYRLCVEVKNKSGELLTKKSIPFQRSNPYINATREEIAQQVDRLEDEFVSKMTVKELRYALKAIAMQVDDVDGELLNTLIREEKPKAMRLYLFSFWAKEDPVNPEGAYNGYMTVANAIDEKFRSGFGYGFETDRGYVYMKYGVPSDVVTIEDEPDAPPYEIWFYNEFPQTGQNNVKFLFFNQSLATNGYRLLHSTARGELNNPQWELQLYSNSPNEIQGSNFVDGTTMQGKIGRQARRLFESY
ncbi:MAG: GWxTD domain-containing protein [Bacteroidota bacterium]